jgi:hypothetical protein
VAEVAVRLDLGGWPTVQKPGDLFGESLMTGEVGATSGEVAGRVTVAVTGTYTVLVEPDDAATGSLDPQLPDTIARHTPLARLWREFEHALDARIADAAITA